MSKINPFLNPLSFNVRQGATSEQSLYHDLAQEITEVAGIPIWYILRELVNYEGNAFFEDAMSEYRKAYPLTVYFENPKEGYDESNTIMAKLGVRFINYVTFQIPMMNFMKETKLSRPREGDVICITAWKNHTDQSPATSGFPTTFFQVKDVAMDKKGYNNFGDVFWFTCKCEQWNYSNQTVETGNPDIDEMFGLMKNQTDSGRTKNDPIDDSEVIAKLGNEIIDWSPDHPFGTEDDIYTTDESLPFDPIKIFETYLHGGTMEPDLPPDDTISDDVDMELKTDPIETFEACLRSGKNKPKS